MEDARAAVEKLKIGEIGQSDDIKSMIKLKFQMGSGKFEIWYEIQPFGNFEAGYFYLSLTNARKKAFSGIYKIMDEDELAEYLFEYRDLIKWL